MQMAMAGAGAGRNGRLPAGVGFQAGRAALSVGYAKAPNDRVRINFGGAFSGSAASAGFGIATDLRPSARDPVPPVCAVACPGEPHPGRNGQAAVQARRVAVGTTCGPGHEVRVHWRAWLRWVRGSSRGKYWGRIRTGTKVRCFPPLSRWVDLEPPGESNATSTFAWANQQSTAASVIRRAQRPSSAQPPPTHSTPEQAWGEIA